MCRSDGAVYHPGSARRSAEWTYGTPRRDGYRLFSYKGVSHLVHRLICRAFHGLAPEGRPDVDHINRDKSDNRCSNLRWLSASENTLNSDRSDRSFAVYGVRYKDDPTAYQRARLAANPEQARARQRARRAADPARVRAQYRAHYASSPEYRARQCARVKARYEQQKALGSASIRKTRAV